MGSDSARSGRTGLLLINLGTPDEPTVPAVRRYLREFLSDPWVIDIPAIGRWLLLNLIILPFRPAKSTEAYKKVWMKEGSPLLVHSLALRDKVRARLGGDWQVELGMRYASPSIASALARLKQGDVDRIIVAPLFPQYAGSSSGTALEKVFLEARKSWNVPALAVLPEFYDDPGFLDAFAAVGRPGMANFKPDHVLFSFHGLPERQVKRSDETGKHCLQSATCCDSIGPANRHCYRAQSYATARQIASRLGLAREQWSVAFQSRLGRTPWITPHTDVVIDELAKKGVKRVLCYSPAFVADCLETLEEIAIRLREQFKASGGEELQLVPSLNSNPEWVETVVAMAERSVGLRRALPPVLRASE
jgi:ferrochelatase